MDFQDADYALISFLYPTPMAALWANGGRVLSEPVLFKNHYRSQYLMLPPLSEVVFPSPVA
jgi:hypothetical protein